ncbi:alpha/beta hydrolase domain-containing protein [Paracoccus sp. (in: a-proteobacteria)]|uniref:alpha/beta hydrolase domain-containing protein n=1 Tax=Paracoccus sp. TaxID=267 RepID=UPI00396CB19F
MRDLIWQGFNGDEADQRVFDGAIPYIAGSRKSFTDASFAQPGRYSRQHEDHDVYGDQFPFSYAVATDPLTGEVDSIFSTCQDNHTCPKLMHVDISTEFWQARAALVSTSPAGEPLGMPENVRLYFMSAAPHFKQWNAESERTDLCQFSTNPLSPASAMRALTQALRDWVFDDKVPPESRYPTVADKTLVPLPQLNLTSLSSKVFLPVYNVLRVRDHSSVPPQAGARYPVLVPQLDEDGLPLAGVKDPAVAALLGTYLGWNLRAEGFAKGSLCGLEGSYLSFPPTEQAAGSDPRQPLSDRYADEAAYLAALEQEGNGTGEGWPDASGRRASRSAARPAHVRKEPDR